MDLKKRLANLDKLSHRKRSDQRQVDPTGESPGAATARAREATLRDLGLSPQPQTAGTVWTRDYPPCATVSSHDEAPAWKLPDLTDIFSAAAPPALTPGQLLFLDTETTGLAGGTGTVAFLIGVAWWTDDGFVVRQFFLAGPGRETPMLHALAELAAEFRVVVTFNGNCFDLPLLRTRALLSRLPDPLRALVSWDLLPAVRRLWGRRLPDCRQQTAEVEICGRERGAGDIDGALIPPTYFRYLREAEPGLLPNVLTHNQRDMVGMAAVLQAVVAAARVIDCGRLATHPRQGGRATGFTSDPPWQDAWSAGRICEARRDRESAACWLERAVVGAGIQPYAGEPAGSSGSSGNSPAVELRELPERLFVDAIRILKRTARWELVEQVILAGLSRWRDRDWLHREAAILYEHRLGRLESARRHAEVLAEPRRLERLNRKLGRD